MDTPIKNATNEKDQPTSFKVEISNGISFGFLAGMGFWFFTVIFGIIVVVVLYAVGIIKA